MPERKIIAVIKGDAVMNGWKDVKDIPPPMLDMLKHFFLTYKLPPANLFNATGFFVCARARRFLKARRLRLVAIPEIYGAEEAMRVIRATQTDYKNKFGDLKGAFEKWYAPDVAARVCSLRTEKTLSIFSVAHHRRRSVLDTIKEVVVQQMATSGAASATSAAKPSK